jgi:DNA-binding protein Fis
MKELILAWSFQRENDVSASFNWSDSMTEAVAGTFNDQSFLREPSIDQAIAERVAQLLAEGNEDVYRIVIEPVEREVVRRVVAHCRGNYLRASRILGISRMTLRKKIGVKRNLVSADVSLENAQPALAIGSSR